MKLDQILTWAKVKRQSISIKGRNVIDVPTEIKTRSNTKSDESNHYSQYQSMKASPIKVFNKRPPLKAAF